MGTEAQVLVVGAGPTGLLLAAELERRGVACHLIDAHSEPMHWDRATIVHPRSLEVFESLGIVDRFLAAGVKQHRARLRSEGKLIGDIDLSICGSRYGFNIGLSEEVTEQFLTEYLHRQGGDVVRAARLVSLDQRPEGVVAQMERSGTREEIRVEWVVGCDGVHSTTRELCGIALEGHDIPEPWAVFDVTLTGWDEPYEAIYAYLDEIPVILTSLPGERWRVYIRPTSADSDLVADAEATIGRYYPEITFDEVTNPTRFHCHTKVAARYRSGRVLIAGDAAHVCSPAQGHGMNSGLHDAFNLAWKLALVCRGQSTPRLLESYEAERRPVAQMITASGDAVEEAQSVHDFAARRARDEAMRAKFADPESKHHEAIAEAELDIDYGGSPIVIGDESAALAAGQRLPDTLQIQHASGEDGLLHELAHRAGHTALVIGGTSADLDELARLGASVLASADEAVVETTVVLASEPRDHVCARLARKAAKELGVDGITLLVVRPDGHVGLRADREHLKTLAEYQSLLASGGS